MVSIAQKEALKRYLKTSKGMAMQKLSFKKYNMKIRYGLSLEDIERMKIEQKNCCKICSKEKKLVVDHNHTNGKVRSLLCYRCNIAVGYIETDRSITPKIIEYLDKH